MKAKKEEEVINSFRGEAGGLSTVAFESQDVIPGEMKRWAGRLGSMNTRKQNLEEGAEP